MSGQPTRSYLIIASAIVIAGILISASLFIAVGGATKTTTTTITTTSIKTVTSTSTIVQSAFNMCLKEIPQNAVLGQYDNSTSQGFTATYANGTEAYFPLGTCPVPVTPDNYLIDSTIEANPAFVSAENGSTYEATNACNCHWSVNISGPTGEWSVLNFVLYSNQRIYPCGLGSYWVYKQLGLILVTIPINSTGGLALSNASIEAGPGNNSYSCTTSTST